MLIFCARAFFPVVAAGAAGAQIHLRQYILLCGAPKDRAHWKEQFLSQPGKKFEIKAEFDLREEGLAGFIEMLHEKTVDIVVFSLDERIIPQVQEALLACEAEGVEAWVSANFIQTLFTRVQFDQFAGQPLLIYRTTPSISWELVIKRLLDHGRLGRSCCCSRCPSCCSIALVDPARFARAGPLLAKSQRAARPRPSACTSSAPW